METSDTPLTTEARETFCRWKEGAIPANPEQPDGWKLAAKFERENAELKAALKELREAIPAHLLVAHAAVPLDPATGFQCGEPSIQTFPRLQKAAAIARAALQERP